MRRSDCGQRRDLPRRLAPADRRQSPSRLAHRNGLSPFSAARVRNSETRLSKCSSCRAKFAPIRETASPLAARVGPPDQRPSSHSMALALNVPGGSVPMSAGQRAERGDHRFERRAALDVDRRRRRE